MSPSVPVYILFDELALKGIYNIVYQLLPG